METTTETNTAVDTVNELLIAWAEKFRATMVCPHREPAPYAGGYPICHYRGADCPHQIRPPSPARYCRWRVNAENALNGLPKYSSSHYED